MEKNKEKYLDLENDPVVKKVIDTYKDVIKVRKPVRNPDLMLKILRDEYKLLVKPYIVYITVAAFMNNRPVLYEGPPGTGKTEIGEAILTLWSGKSAFVLPCSENYDEYRVIGDFHPAMAMAKGFNEESFIPRPLLAALILDTGVLIDEIRRSNEDFQNLLLDIIDKRRIIIPELKKVYVQKGNGFQIIFTSNPLDIAQNELSDAFLRRVIRIEFKYPSLEEEYSIIKLRLGNLISKLDDQIISKALKIVRIMREKALYKPGTADLVSWLTLTVLLADSKNKKKADIKDLIEAGYAILYKNTEDEELVNDVLK
ncbi:MAG: MoxR family ATPase [Thermoprotei archaeon]|nr:MAG: MoxR family ATPase [Thermoprotei archaeon]